MKEKEGPLGETPNESAYARAGVDIHLANKLKQRLPELLASTRRRGVMGKVGGFGGLFALDLKRYQRPVLVSSVDGVGTKLKIAFAVDRHDTVGQDLVNHCVNDIAVLGAEPLFFLDYIATAKLEPRVFSQLIEGLAKACKDNGCALLGGETAQMPGFYREGEYDIAGTIIGVVERKAIVSGAAIRPGDLVIGVESNGLHTNGYSLVRRIFLEQLGWPLDRHVPELGKTLAEELLRIHRSYWPLIRRLLRRFGPQGSGVIHGLAHITGGGFYDNIPRILCSNCCVVIEKGSWPVQAIFELIQQLGSVEPREMYHVFNMGIGLVIVVHPSQAEAVLRAIRQDCQGWIIGRVERGERAVKITGIDC